MEKDKLDFIKYLKYERNFSENTIVSYDNDLKNYFAFLETENINYLTINKEQVRKYLKYLDECKMKNSSISRAISTLRSFYTYLMREEKIKTNIFKRIENPKVKRKLPNFLSEIEMQDIFNSMKKKTPLEIRDCLIIEFLYATGIRISELLMIKVNDIDKNDKTIKILGKGSKERIVYYGDYAKDILDTYLKVRKEINENDSVYLFINKKGNPLNPVDIKNIINETLKNAQVNHKISAHTFRHTFATHLLNNGADIKSVQELLGHENLSTTQIYTHVTSERSRKEYRDKFPRN